MSTLTTEASVPILTETGVRLTAEGAIFPEPVVDPPSRGTSLREVAILAPRNGTSGRTVATDGTGGSVFMGATFTPVPGRLLVAVVAGAVTSTTPAGWTLSTGASAVGNTGAYVFWKIATGSDSLVTTHNGSNYPLVVHFMEFKAGSTFVSAVSATAVAAGTANPTLSGLSGTTDVYSVASQFNSSTTAVSTTAWSSGITRGDMSVVNATTDGITYGMVEARNNTAASVSGIAPTQTPSSNASERITFALSVAA